jgi:toxin YoeB
VEIAYTQKAKEDIAFWKNSGNKKVMSKISDLLVSIEASPFQGIGKPEALKHQLAGYWSRRINLEHRLVYKVENSKIVVHSLYGHYQ